MARPPRIQPDQSDPSVAPAWTADWTNIAGRLATALSKPDLRPMDRRLLGECLVCVQAYIRGLWGSFHEKESLTASLQVGGRNAEPLGTAMLELQNALGKQYEDEARSRKRKGLPSMEHPEGVTPAIGQAWQAVLALLDVELAVVLVEHKRGADVAARIAHASYDHAVSRRVGVANSFLGTLEPNMEEALTSREGHRVVLNSPVDSARLLAIRVLDPLLTATPGALSRIPTSPRIEENEQTAPSAPRPASRTAAQSKKRTR